MKRIILTQGKIVLVDDEDYGWLSQYKWCAQACCSKRGDLFYAKRKGKKGEKANVLMHREIFVVSKGIEVDHKDCNGLNNQKSNLRACTRYGNTRNTRPAFGKSSIFKGVCRLKQRKKWCSRIWCDGKNKELGYFQDEIEAALAYDKAAKELFGDFARINF